jgi:hypothetical protein
MIFAYFGPETTLPLASVLAGILGVLMMFGRAASRLLARPLRVLLRK